VAEPLIVKPLPPDLFVDHGTNAEMRWDAIDGQDLVPNDRFFVRNHTRTPVIDAATWTLRLHGTGVRQEVELGYDEIRALPATELAAVIECVGNARAYFTTQQHQLVEGTPWRLGGIGAASWRGVRLATVLELAGLAGDAVDVMPRGLDDDWVYHGVNYGPPRRPLPIEKALDDVLLAYEMNGEPLPPDHGFPLRVVVPSWAGIASIKWVGSIEISRTPLTSPWNTEFYRLDGEPITRQVVRSAFELPWNAELAAGEEHVLRGRSWSGNGLISAVEVSTDDGERWSRAEPVAPQYEHGWLRWEVRWRPSAPGPYALRARATDESGMTQPTQTSHNPYGYLFDAVVAHPVTVVALG
jgi:DMSO/TMAO reductase YedYZ molybdopterin-dependent catalytic subunit